MQHHAASSGKMPDDHDLYALTAALQPARRAWIQAANAILLEHGLSIPVATLLLHVARSGEDATQSTLARTIGVNPGALVRTLDQAERAGLLVRVVGGDRRVRRVSLTPAGQEEVDRIASAMATLRRQLLPTATAAQVQACAQLLGELEVAALAFVQQESKR